MICLDFLDQAFQFPAQFALEKHGKRLIEFTRAKRVVFGVVVCGLVVGISTTSSAQIPGHFAVNTVNYNVAGTVSTFHGSETPRSRNGSLNGSDFAQTFGPLSVDPDDGAEYQRVPASIKGTVADAVMSGESMAAGSVTIEASAETGALRVEVDGKLRASSASNLAIANANLIYAYGQARWQDTSRFVHTFDPHPGRIVKLESFLDLSGSIGITNKETPPFSSSNRLASSAVTLRLTAARVTGLDPLPEPTYGAYFARGGKSSVVTVDVNETAPGMIPVTLFVKEGELITIDFMMEVRAQGRTTNNSYNSALGLDGNIFETSFIGAFGNTLKWGGITSVTDALTGDPITGWSIISASGFDYAHAYQESVPEPASISLALMGLAGIVCVATKRRRDGAVLGALTDLRQPTRPCP